MRDALKRVKRRGRGAHLRRAQVLHAPVAGPHGAGAPRAHRAGRGARAAGAEPPGGRGPGGPAALPRGSALPDRGARARAGSRSPTSSRTSSCSAARTAALVRLKDVGRAELGAENYAQLLRFNGTAGGGPRHLPAAHRQRARRARRGRRGDGAAVQPVPAGHEVPSRASTPRSRCAPPSTRCCMTLAEAIAAGHPGHLPVPARLAQRAHHRAHPAGLADRHLRLREAVRLLHQHAHALRPDAGHGPGGGRRHRGHREHRAPHGGAKL